MSESYELRVQRRKVRLIAEVCADAKVHGAIVGHAAEPLVSLTAACAPLIDIVQDLFDYVSVALEFTPEQPADGLSRDESASVRLYTMEWTDSRSLYSILNRTLRTADREGVRPWFKYLKLFLTALVKIPCSPQQTTWHGVKKNIDEEFLCGAEVTWWAFSSCTTSLRVLENELYLGNVGKRTLFSMEAFNARNICGHSHYYNEDEILMLPGTYMTAQSQFCPATDLRVVHLRQKTPKETLLEPSFDGACLYPNNEQDSRHPSETSSTNYILPPVTPPWYRKKQFVIPICLLIIVCLVAVILGSVLGSRSSTSTLAPLCYLNFTPMLSYSTGYRSPESIAVGDFNNDSRQDIAVAIHNGNNMGIFLAYGNGTFAEQTMFLTGFNPWAVTVANFNNDNRLDIAVANGVDDNVGIILGYSDGTFAAQMTFPTDNNPWAITVADFNDDNRMDIVVANHDRNNMGIFLGYGNGTFAAQTTFPSGSQPYSIAVGGFNNDTRLDIAVVNFADNNVGIFLGYDNGSFAAQTTFSIGNNPQSVVFSDFNKDNQLDIAVTNYGSGTVSILLGYGNGTFAAQTTFPTGSNPDTITIADFNKNNQLDFAVANHGSNTVGIFLNICHCCTI